MSSCWDTESKKTEYQKTRARSEARESDASVILVSSHDFLKERMEERSERSAEISSNLHSICMDHVTIPNLVKNKLKLEYSIT